MPSTTVLSARISCARRDIAVEGLRRPAEGFTEDVDITYDIRSFAPDLVTNADAEALHPTRSQERRWTRTIRGRLADWVQGEARPTIGRGFAQAGFAARIRAHSEKLHIVFDPLFEDFTFIRPEVMVEFCARSTGNPNKFGLSCGGLYRIVPKVTRRGLHHMGTIV